MRAAWMIPLALATNVSAAALAQSFVPVQQPVRVPTQTIRPHLILPPVEYDKHYSGDLTIKIVPDIISLRAACSTDNETMLACAWHNDKSCVIYMVEDRIMRQRGWNTGLLLRHEIGHCNGWPVDHPGQRALTAPSTYFVPQTE